MFDQERELKDILVEESIESQQSRSTEPYHGDKLSLRLDPGSASIVLYLDRLDPYIEFLSEWIESAPHLFRFLIFLDDTSSVKHFYEQAQFKSFFAKRSLRICSAAGGVDEERYTKAFVPQDKDRFEDTRFYSLGGKPAEFQKISNQLQTLHRLVVSQLEFTGTAFMGSVKSMYMGFENALTNLEAFLQTPDFRNWKDLAKGVPAIVLGAGPSLDNDIEWAFENKDRMIIIASDTLAKPLAKRGVSPHCFVSIERTKEVGFLFEKNQQWPETVLCANNLLDRSVFETFKGAKSLVMADNDFNHLLGFARMVISHGHSCVGLGLRLASILGCSPVLLSGVDLCWGAERQSHFSGNPYDGSKDFAGFEADNKERLEKAIVALSNQGEEVYTNHYWGIFRREFESIIKNSKSTFYNLASDGVVINGAEWKSREDFVSLIASQPAHDYSKLFLSKLSYERTEQARAELLHFVGRLEVLDSELQSLLPHIRSSSGKDIETFMRKAEFYKSVYSPLFHVSFLRMNSVREDVRKEEAAAIHEHLEKLAVLVRRRSKELRAFSEASPKPLY